MGEGGDGGDMSVTQQLVLERQNQVHYYIRGIQMEQLLEQDLDADLKTIRDEVSASVKNEDFGKAKSDSLRQRLDKQLLIVKKRCEALITKASETSSENSNVRLNIDDLRKEKMSHREQLQRMRAKATKMDEDIAFLTHAAHAALDQREKVRGKFLMAQRDMQQERDQKLAVIGELVQRIAALDDDAQARAGAMQDQEEVRRRQAYAKGRRQRSELEAAEVRFGFLTSQARGWESEFERLQTFTGMETKFTPGQNHIVDEITSRYAEKERANTSLLRYLNEQQAECHGLEERGRQIDERRGVLEAAKGVKLTGVGGGQTPEEIYAAASEEDGRSAHLEQILLDACPTVQAATRSLWRDSAGVDSGGGGAGGAAGLGQLVPKSVAEGTCTVPTLEKWLQTLERRLFKLYGLCQIACGQGSDGQSQPLASPPLVLSDWCTRDRVAKVTKVTVPEIHEALCQQAAQQRRGGELEEDDEETGEAERKEAEAKKSPFERKKVNKAQERQRIIDWARKRQPGQAKMPPQQADKVHRAMEAAAAQTAPGGIRVSSSAPVLRPAANGASVEDRLNRRLEGGAGNAGGAGGAGSLSQSACALPAINESGSAVAGGGGAARTAGDRAAAHTAQFGALAPPSSGGGGAHGPSGANTATLGPVRTGAGAGGGGGGAGAGAGGGGGRSGGGGRLRQAASASMPGLSAAPPKDLGTVIYLLGTQSNSMNARRFLRPDGGAGAGAGP